MSSNENWVRDQVVAAHRQIERERLEAEQRIERNKERAAALAAAVREGERRYAAAFDKFEKQAFDRVGALLTREFGTQNIDQLAALPRVTTDAALAQFRHSFNNDIKGIRGKQSKKRVAMMVFGGTVALAGITLLNVNIIAGVAAILIGTVLAITADVAFPDNPTPDSGDSTLYLLLRCDRAVKEMLYMIDEKRASLGLQRRI